MAMLTDFGMNPVSGATPGACLQNKAPTAADTAGTQLTTVEQQQ